MRLLFMIVMFALANPVATLAAKRLGLVIGNDNYAEVPTLDKARGDAQAMSDELAELGFEVITVLDAPRRQMNAKIAEFTGRLQPGDTAMVFFAGHGVEIDGENYLLPTDIAAPSASGEDFIKYESIALSDLLVRVQSTGARTTLVFLDACRDNPFTGVAGRSIGGSRGLARVAAPEGTFVVFSAGARQQALDRLNDADTNKNSVFTRLLLPKLSQPDLELRQLVSDLRIEVRDLARTQNHSQFPAYYDELLGQFYFASDRGLVPAQSDDVASDSGSDLQVRSDFELAQSLGTIVAYETFLNKYDGKSDDLAVSMARNILRDLNADTAAAIGAPEAGTDQPVVETLEEPAPNPTDATRHLESRTAIILASQQQLNALGCSAGGADGVIGPRTRNAFANFIRQSGAKLKDSMLGSQYALDVMAAHSGIVCKASAAAPKPDVPSENPTVNDGAEPLALTGNWFFKANCALIVNTTGSTILRRTGPGTYSVRITDSLGQKATGTYTERDGRISGTQRWSSGIVSTITATLSADRRSYRGSDSAGCTFVGNKVSD